MNLGAVWVDAFLTIAGAASVAGILAATVLRLRARLHWAVVGLLAVVFAALLTLLGNFFGHGPLFRSWHRDQNTVVPKSGCLTYEPWFGGLSAAYSMTRAEFQAWATGHSWGLTPYDLAHADVDRAILSFGEPEDAFATRPAPGGGQLRAYYVGGTAYIFYNSW